jgi:Ion channel
LKKLQPYWKNWKKSVFFWFFVYIFTVTLFAFIYDQLPGENFYYATIIHEDSFRDDVDDFAKKLSIDLNTAAQNKLKSMKRADAKYDEKLSYVASGYTAASSGFKINLDAEDISNATPKLVASIEIQTLINVDSLISGKSSAENTFDYLDFQITKGYHTDDAYWWRPAFTTEASFNPKKLSATVGISTIAALKTLFQAQRGLGVGVRDRFWRLWYYSMVVIASLGFGDILPITKNARIATSIEVMLGIFIAGLAVSNLIDRVKKD